MVCNSVKRKESTSSFTLDHHFKGQLDSTFNMYEGLYLPYQFRVEHEANLVTCRLGHKIIKYRENAKFARLLFRLHISMNKNVNSHKAIPWFKMQRSARYTLHLSSCATLIKCLSAL